MNNNAHVEARYAANAEYCIANGLYDMAQHWIGLAAFERKRRGTLMQIAELTKAAGTLPQVSLALGVSSRTVTKWRAGKCRGIAFRHVVALCRMAGVDVRSVVVPT